MNVDCCNGSEKGGDLRRYSVPNHAKTLIVPKAKGNRPFETPQSKSYGQRREDLALTATRRMMAEWRLYGYRGVRYSLVVHLSPPNRHVCKRWWGRFIVQNRIATAKNVIQSFAFSRAREWASERTCERNDAREQCEQCAASEWVSGATERTWEWPSAHVPSEGCSEPLRIGALGFFATNRLIWVFQRPNVAVIVMPEIAYTFFFVFFYKRTLFFSSAWDCLPRNCFWASSVLRRVLNKSKNISIWKNIKVVLNSKE